MNEPTFVGLKCHNQCGLSANFSPVSQAFPVCERKRSAELRFGVDQAGPEKRAGLETGAPGQIGHCALHRAD
jgi:hypothetical protein